MAFFFLPPTAVKHLLRDKKDRLEEAQQQRQCWDRKREDRKRKHAVKEGNRKEGRKKKAKTELCWQSVNFFFKIGIMSEEFNKKKVKNASWV